MNGSAYLCVSCNKDIAFKQYFRSLTTYIGLCKLQNAECKFN